MGFDRRFLRLRLAMAGALLASPCFANLDRDSLDALKRLSIEELLQVEVTSVSRTGESLRGAAAAISVVSPDIIRRTGATTVPDSLRLVPGIHVGQQSSSSWAVSARGFSSVSSEKLLVLSDTRSIYTPLFSGVLWDVQDYLLEDIERIEVIRGPGAALWGSNAVNGVINITTRSARDTHGTYLSAAAGSHERLELAARQGGETAGGLHYRVFAKYSDRDGTEHPDIVADDDDWRFAHVGFRTDWDASSRDSFTVQGDAYRGEIGQIAPVVQIIGRPGPASPLELQASGGNLLARWRRSSEDSADMQLRVYYDYTRRDDPSFLDTLHTVDIDFQQQLAQLGRHEVIWGTSYRVTDNRNRRGEVFAVVPEDSTDHLFSGFIQDQIAFSDQVRLTLGTKLEHNDFSGFEVQPSVRVAWSPEEAHTLWSAISRAVRVPTRLERDISVDATDPAGNPVARLLGNDDFDSEELIAYEAGYRWQPLSNLSTDLALFYNDYQKLVSLEFAEPFLQDDGRIIVPIVNENLGDGATRGVEIQVEWSPLPYWHLTGSYSYLDMQLGSSGQDLNRNEWYEDSTPRHLSGLRSFLTLGERFEIDAQLRHQSRIRAISEDIARTGIDAYTELDLRLAWRVNEDWDLSLVGQNLLDDSHLEFGSPGDRGGIERSAYLKAEWHN